MKSNFIRNIAVFSVIILTFISSAFSVSAESTNPADTAGDILNEIISVKMKEAGADDIQSWIDGSLAENAGISSEWYVMGLSHEGKYDFSAYADSLEKYLKENDIRSATARQKFSLALISIGKTNSIVWKNAEDTIGKQGIMSWVYGLHLMNNGYVDKDFSLEDVTGKLISLQLADGGWAVMGERGDTDVTAMTIQALSPYYNDDKNIRAAIDKGLDFLSAGQKENGGFASMGQENPESASQVLIALSSLGIDFSADERFVKNGNTVLDAISEYRLENGLFCHAVDGGANETATVQAYFALTSYKVMKNGGSVYIFPKESLIKSAETETSASAEDIRETADNIIVKSNKIKLLIAAILSFAAVTAVLFLVFTKRKNNKNFIFVGIVWLAGIAAVIFIDIKTPEEYYHGEKIVKSEPVGTVSMSIRCDTIVGKTDNKYIPSDGVILDETEFEIESGESVFDILTEAAAVYGIPVENHGNSSNAHGMVYIAGINYIYELDYGDLSGWIYHVNGEAPSVGCGEYILSDGDVIEWLYTCDLGNDLGDDSGRWE